jgi:hypothetical protein
VDWGFGSASYVKVWSPTYDVLMDLTAVQDVGGSGYAVHWVFRRLLESSFALVKHE